MTKRFKILLTALGVSVVFFLYAINKKPGTLEANTVELFGMPSFDMSDEAMTALTVLILGVSIALIIYGIAVSDENSAVKRFFRSLRSYINTATEKVSEDEEYEEDYIAEDVRPNESVEPMPMTLRQKILIDEYKKTRYVQLGVWSGFKFGFGFGIGLFLAGIFMFIFSIVFWGAALTAILSSLVS